MTKTYITYAKRTAIGKLGGKLANIRPDDLLAHVFMDLKNQLSFDLKLIDDVIVGCANQAGEDNRNIARMSLILAGFPFEVPGATINRLCGSSLDALIDAHARIKSGIADCIIVGGVESMTRSPLVMSKATEAFGRDQKIFDTTLGWRFPNARMQEIFPLLGMGETAEEVARDYSISREEQDQYALSSHQKAAQAQKEGKFKDEIIPIEIKTKKDSFIFAEDECIRPDSTMEALQKLKPVFKKDGSVTAGNSSPMNDGASALMIVSESFLKEHKLTPLMEITGAATRGVHPNIMGIGPIAAVETLLKRTNKKITDFDAIEINEAFAAQALGCIKGLGIDQNKVNLQGGAIAIGHALGNSGVRIVTTLTHIMQKNPQYKEGLATMCIGVGQGVAMSFKNCK